MSRLRGMAADQVPAEVQEFYAQDEKRFGDVLYPTRVFARRPTILAGMRALTAGVARSGLIETPLQAIVCVRVAGLNRCPF